MKNELVLCGFVPFHPLKYNLSLSNDPPIIENTNHNHFVMLFEVLNVLCL